jgi:hypothetical protein
VDEKAITNAMPLTSETRTLLMATPKLQEPNGVS